MTLKVININPFVHQYRISGSVTAYSEGAFAEFAKLGLGLGVSTPEPPKTTQLPAYVPAATLAPPFAGGPNPGCSPNTEPNTVAGARSAAVAIEQEADATRLFGEALNRRLVSLARRGDEFASGTKELRSAIVDPRLDAATLLLKATALANLIRPYVEGLSRAAGPVADSITSYVAAVAGVGADAKDKADKYPTCALFVLRHADVARWSADTAVLRGIGSRMASTVLTLTSDLAAVDRVVKTPALLEIVRAFGDYDDPTIIDLTIQRSPAGSDTAWRSIANPRLQFGTRGRFSLGVGLVSGQIPTVEYAPQNRYQTPAAPTPADSVVSIVAKTRSSPEQVAPILTLSVRFLEFESTALDGVTFVIGSTPKTDQSKLTLSYFAGLGITGFDQRVLLSVGVIRGETQSLAAGYSENSRITAAQATVPTVTTWATSAAIVLAFRVF